MDIVNLGLVYDCRVEEIDSKVIVQVQMTLTAPGCGMGPTIAADARSRILSLEGIDDATVDLVWDLPWNQDMISEEGRMKLGDALKADFRPVTAGRGNSRRDCHGAEHSKFAFIAYFKLLAFFCDRSGRGACKGFRDTKVAGEIKLAGCFFTNPKKFSAEVEGNYLCAGWRGICCELRRMNFEKHTVSNDPFVLLSPEELDLVTHDQIAITGLIGMGTTGVVYKAQQIRLGRTVAVKVLSKIAPSAFCDVRERFMLEARTLGRLNHPNIVRVHDIGETKIGWPYLVMEGTWRGSTSPPSSVAVN